MSTALRNEVGTTGLPAMRALGDHSPVSSAVRVQGWTIEVEEFFDYEGNIVATRTTDDQGTTWTKNGKLHREDGPAAESLWGCKMWYLNGERYRVDGGPVVEWSR